MLWIRVKRLPFRPPSNPAQIRSSRIFQICALRVAPDLVRVAPAVFCLGESAPNFCGWADLVRVAQNGLRAV